MIRTVIDVQNCQHVLRRRGFEYPTDASNKGRQDDDVDRMRDDVCTP